MSVDVDQFTRVLKVDDLVQIVYRDDDGRVFRFRVGTLRTVVTVRLHSAARSRRVEFTCTHAIKTPVQVGPYRTSSPFANTSAAALRRAIAGLTDYYRQAQAVGHDPNEGWLIPYNWQIKNQVQLNDWLRTQAPQDSLAIAVRVMLRCMWAPITHSKDADYLSLVAFRTSILGMIAAKETATGRPPSPSRGLKLMAAKKHPQHSEMLSLCRSLLRCLETARGHCRADYPDAVADVATIAAAIIVLPADESDSWDAIASDVQVLGSGDRLSLMESPLFPHTKGQQWLMDEVNHSQSRYRKLGFGFVADWYKRVVDGVPLELQWLREVAELPDNDWTQDTKHIADRIAEVEDRRRLREATPLAEEIVFDDESGTLRIRPMPMLPQDLYYTGLDKLRDAMEDIRKANIRDTNSYTALDPAVRLLERTLARYADNPQRVHDDQLLAHRRIRKLVDHDVIPDDDEVGALLQILDSNAIDIRAAIPQVELAVKKRTRVRVRELEEDEITRVRAAIEDVARHSDDALARDMRDDERDIFTAGAAAVGVESPYRAVSRLASAKDAVRPRRDDERPVGLRDALARSLGHSPSSLLLKLLGL